MAEQIPFAIVERLISTLGSTALDEIKLAKNAKQDLIELERTVTFIRAALKDADKQPQRDELFQQRIIRLKEVLYEADDLLDEAATKSLRRKVDAPVRLIREVFDFFSSSNQLVSRFKLGHQIKEIREKLDAIENDKKLPLSFPPHGDAVVLVNNPRKTYPEMPTYKIIGREKNEKDIINLLKQPADNDLDIVSIVAIVGIGGLGKTTLAQMVYSDQWVNNHFTKKVWVCVSEVFDPETLAKKILKCLLDVKVDDLDLQQLQDCHKENLKKERYLLVLDDVWNERMDRWDLLKRFLIYGAQGSKILVTTRSKKVASVMGVDVKTDYLYEMKGLSDEESCNLFEHNPFKGVDELSSSRGLLEIGKELVTKRCKGVPLAINTLASAIRSYPHEDYWSAMKENDQMWRSRCGEDNVDGIFPVLMLSYYHLPNHLKQCFSYCSLFPKDTEIDKELLVRLWLAQGYLHSSDGIDLEENGNMYFHELMARSFFQEAEQDVLGNIMAVKIHDLIHDLAILVSGNDFLFSVRNKEKKILERVHHIVFDLKVENVQSNEVTTILNLISKVKAKLRTLEFTGHEGDGYYLKFPVSVFLNFKCLRVLVLRFSSAELSSSIGKLMHLRFLIIKNSLLRKLPDTICDLLNLQTLELNCCGLEALPKNLRKLVRLRHLIVDSFKLDGCIELGQLVSLRHLKIPVLRCMGLGRLTWLRQLPELYVSVENRDALNELCGLNLLKGVLCLNGLQNVRDVESEAKQVNLKAKKCLQLLHLRWSNSTDEKSNASSTRIKTDESLLDNLEPHPNLKAMFVFGYGGERFSGWLSCITSLVSMCIVRCHNCKYLPPLNQLKSLKEFYLSEMQSLEYVELSSEASSSSAMVMTNCFFPSLEELTLQTCPIFRGWRRNNDKDEEADVDLELQPCNWFPRLSKLIIDECPKLSSMPLFPTLEEQLVLSSTSVKPLQQTMEMKITNENAASSSSSSFTCLQLSSSPLTKLKRLRLVSLEDLQSVTLLEGFCALTALESLEIINCPRVTSLPDSFDHLSSLQSLLISGCEELSERCRKDNGPEWLKIQHIRTIRTDYDGIGKWEPTYRKVIIV